MGVGQIPHLEILQHIAQHGSASAAEALGMFSGNTLTVEQASVRMAALEEVPCLHGDPTEVVVGVNLAMTGDLDGFLLAFFHRRDAMLLITQLMGSAPPEITDLSEMELSALGEAGNIIASAFLSTLEKLLGLVVLPSPPAVAIEMCGAITESVVLPVLEAGGQLLLIEAEIIPTDAGVIEAASCRVLFLPTPDSWPRLQQALTPES
jgi:chemotaxis protein CheC